MKRHSNVEIQAMLRQAQQLESRGQSQSEICKTLGISVMTFHRWRKQVGRVSLQTSEATSSPANFRGEHAADEISTQIDELKLENSRLRKIVGDLLLEKLKLEEVAAATQLRKVAK